LPSFSSIREFWRNTYLPSRLALACAAFAIALNLASYAGLAMRGPFAFLAIFHVIIMGLGFFLFGRMVYNLKFVWRTSPNPRSFVGVPMALFWATVFSFVYFVVMFFGALALYGDGNAEFRGGNEVLVAQDSVIAILPHGTVAEYAARELRIFSAAWIFFALMIAICSHYVERNIQQFRLPRG
jgi:hypothetical protein